LFFGNHVQRSLTRRTNFNPDQTSVTGANFYIDEACGQADIAHDIFVQIGGDGRKLFLGQLTTKKIPAGASSFVIRLNSLASAVFDL